MRKLIVIAFLALLVGEAEAQSSSRVRITSDTGNIVKVTSTAGGAAQIECVAGCATVADTVGATQTFNDSSDVATVTLAGNRGAIVNIASGTCEATFLAEVSTDGGTTWKSAQIGDVSTGAVSPSIVLTNPNGVESFTILHPGPITNAKLKVGSITSGSCNVHLRSVANNPVVMVYGSDGTSPQIIPFKSSTPVGSEMAPIFRCIGCTSTGGTSAADNTLWVYGTTAVTPSGHVYDTTPTAPTDGNVGVGRMNVNRDAHAFLTDPSGAAVAESSTNAIRVTPVTVVSIQGYNRRNSGTLGSLNAVVAIDASASGSITWEVDTGTLSGTVVFEGTNDDTNWFALDAIELGGTSPGRIISKMTTFGRRGHFRQVGFKQARLRVSAYTSGTSNGRVELSIAPSGINPSAINCTESVKIGTSASGNTALVTAVTGELIYVCGWDVVAGGTTNVKLLDGTGGTCGAGTPIDLTGPYPLTAQAGLARSAPTGSTITKTTGVTRELCVNNSSAVQISGVLNYARF